MADNGWTTVSKQKKKKKKKTGSSQGGTPSYRNTRESNGGTDYADFNTVTLTKRRPAPKAGTSVRKYKGSAEAARARKIEEDADAGKSIKKVGKEIAKEIQQARMAKGWKQKQLAQQCNLQASVIQSIENGSAPYNGSQIAMIKRKLGISGGRKKKKNQK